MSADGVPQHAGDMAAQIALALDNLEAVLRAAEMSLAKRRALERLHHRRRVLLQLLRRDHGAAHGGGAWSRSGATREEVSERIHEAVDAYVLEMAELGKPLPEPVAATGTIHAA